MGDACCRCIELSEKRRRKSGAGGVRRVRLGVRHPPFKRVSLVIPSEPSGESRDLLDRTRGRSGYDDLTVDTSTPPLRGSARDDNELGMTSLVNAKPYPAVSASIRIIV